MDVLFALNKLPRDQGMPWVGFNLILLKRLMESDFIRVHELNGGMIMGDVMGDIKPTPDVIYITDRGRQFIADVGLKEF
jgi:hypothetical protein